MEVTREIVVPAPAEEVWAALTEADRLEEWFANDVELDPRPGGEGVFRWDNGEELHATVEEVDEERRLALRWEDGGEVELTLEEVDAGTRVVVRESSPEFGPALELHALALALA
ncbi:MAG: SRPBCC family protein [Gaiellaceae bacterium]